MHKPPFRADHVGSFLRPAALIEARAAYRAGAIDAAGLRAAEDAAIRDVVAMQEGVLLGNFVSLLAVRAEAARQGIGRALMAAVEARTPPRRWLYVSADAGNAGALGFYRKLGFKRVGRLPDLVRQGHVELLLRKAVPRPA